MYNHLMASNSTPLDDSLLKKKNDYPKSSSFGKETGPVGEMPVIKEVVEHTPDAEVERFVSPRSETIELPPDLKKMGLQAVSSTKFPSYQNVKLPISDDKVVNGLHAPITSSLRWLATFAVYILARAHLALKTVHGKVIRVVKIN